MARSRCRVGWCEFSARLFRYLDCRCSTDGITSRCATPQLRSLSVTSTRRRALPLEEFAETAWRPWRRACTGRGCRGRCRPGRSPPQMLPTAGDRQEHLAEMPRVGGPFPAAAQPAGVFRPELGTPLPDRLVGDDHAADQHELLDLTEAQREAVYSHTQCAIISAGYRWPLYDTSPTLIPPPAYRLRDHPLRPHHHQPDKARDTHVTDVRSGRRQASSERIVR